MEQVQGVTNAAQPAEQAPVAEHIGGTGPNEFEQNWNAMSAAIESVNASPVGESGPALGQPGTPQGSPGDGATNASDASGQDSFLSAEETARFDTNSPEYKAMQASFTRKMQALAEKERQLEARAKPEPTEAPSVQITPPEIDYSKIKVASVTVPDEFEPYRDSVAQIAIEVGKQLVSQLQAQAEAVEQQQQRAQSVTKIQHELAEIQGGPRAAEFNHHYNAIKAIAVESPTLLQAVGLTGILNMLSGGGKPAHVENGQNGYAQGVQDTLSRMTSRKQAATYEPVQSPQGATTAAPFQFKPGVSLNDAVAQAFQTAKARQAR